MGTWEKLEALLNKILGPIFGFFARLLSKITPKQIPILKEKIKEQTKIKKEQAKVLAIAGLMKSISYSKQTFIKIKSINWKEKFKKSENDSSVLNSKSPKELLKKGLEVLVSPLNYIINKLTTMTPGQAILNIIIGGIVFVGVMEIFTSGQKIYLKTRKPAQIESDKMITRPTYYKLEHRQIVLNQVKFPVYNEKGKNNIQFLSIDFQMDMSNRNSVLYIYDHEASLRDHLINNTEPIDPTFSLEKEGKGIIKEKVKTEVDIFLKNNSIEGTAEDVNIIYLLGS